MMASKPTSVDDYIRAAPIEAQPNLRELRHIVLESAPGVTEKISYGMPTSELAGRWPAEALAAALGRKAERLRR